MPIVIAAIVIVIISKGMFIKPIIPRINNAAIKFGTIPIRDKVKFLNKTKNIINMRRNPLLVIATMLAVLVSSFLVFTTLSARAIVENNTSRWQNGVHVVVFLDDRVTSTAHQQLQETLESYSEVRMVEYF